MKRIWAMMAMTALLLAGCARQPVQPEESTQPEPPAAEEQKELPTVEEQPVLTLAELLADIYSAAPGTAGGRIGTSGN